MKILLISELAEYLCRPYLKTFHHLHRQFHLKERSRLLDAVFAFQFLVLIRDNQSFRPLIILSDEATIKLKKIVDPYGQSVR